MRQDRLLLEDILERIALIAEFTSEGESSFMGSRLIQEAVIRSLEIIGEAAGGLSQALREQNRDIPWPQIIAFRNFVIHSYWQIKLERVWEVVSSDLPHLQLAAQRMLDGLPPELPEND